MCDVNRTETMLRSESTQSEFLRIRDWIQSQWKDSIKDEFAGVAQIYTKTLGYSSKTFVHIRNESA